METLRNCNNNKVLLLLGGSATARRQPLEVWIRKCEAELSGSALPLKATVHATLAAPSPDAWVVGCRTNSLLFAKSKTSLVIFSLGSLLFPWIFSGYDSAEFIYDSSSMNAVEVS